MCVIFYMILLWAEAHNKMNMDGIIAQVEYA